MIDVQSVEQFDRGEFEFASRCENHPTAHDQVTLRFESAMRHALLLSYHVSNKAYNEHGQSAIGTPH